MTQYFSIHGHLAFGKFNYVTFNQAIVITNGKFNPEDNNIDEWHFEIPEPIIIKRIKPEKPEDGDDIIKWVKSYKKYYKNLQKVFHEGEIIVLCNEPRISVWLESINIKNYTVSAIFEDEYYNTFDEATIETQKIYSVLYRRAVDKGCKYVIAPPNNIISFSDVFFLRKSDFLRYNLIEQDEDNVYFINYEDAIMESMKTGRPVIKLLDNL